jgi:hypothetical protein
VVSAGHFHQRLKKSRVRAPDRWDNRIRGFTLKHVFDEYGAFCDVLFDDELFVVRGDKENHGWMD